VTARVPNPGESACARDRIEVDIVSWDAQTEGSMRLDALQIARFQ
jgi:hypothetical protein